MNATDFARRLVPALIRQGFRASLFPLPLPNGYGHKIALSGDIGPPLGALVIYHGKQGARYVTTELKSPTLDVLARIALAWMSLGHRSTPVTPAATGDPSATVKPGTIELWVDGACLQRPEGLKFGWACVIRQDGREHYRQSSSRILPHMAALRNVAAELQAVIHGLEQCARLGYDAVTVFYDYAGIEQWATGQWQAATRTTQDYVQFIARCPISITWQKVRAHSGILMNELVDQLATDAAEVSFERFTLPA